MSEEGSPLRPETLERDKPRWAQRIEETEALLATAMTPRQVVQALMQRWGTNRQMARSYVRAAMLRWEQDARLEPREGKRARHRARLEGILTQALERTRAVLVGDGEGAQHVEHVPDPDLAVALRASEALAKFDAIGEASPDDELKKEVLELARSIRTARDGAQAGQGPGAAGASLRVVKPAGS